MNKFIYFLIFTIGFLFSGYASNTEEKCGLAYRVIKLDNPQQKILLIPSCHSYPLYKILPAPLIKEAKDMDALIMEIDPSEKNSRNALTIIQALLKDYFKLDLLKENDMYNEESFYSLDYPYKDWTENLKAATKNYIANIMEPYLPKDKLGHLEPSFVFYILTSAQRYRANQMGIDSSLAKGFTLAGKPIFALETVEDRMKALQATGKPIYPRFNRSIKLIEAIEKYVNDLQENFLESRSARLSTVLRTEMGQAYKDQNIQALESIFNKEHNHPSDKMRTQAWVDPLIKILNRNPEKSFLIVVGGAHVIGNAPDNLVELLTPKGFKFTLYNGKKTSS